MELLNYHKNSKYTINVLKHIQRKSNKEDGMRHLFKQDVSLIQGKGETPTTFSFNLVN
jgi:hypothetical protein